MNILQQLSNLERLNFMLVDSPTSQDLIDISNNLPSLQHLKAETLSFLAACVCTMQQRDAQQDLSRICRIQSLIYFWETSLPADHAVLAGKFSVHTSCIVHVDIGCEKSGMQEKQPIQCIEGSVEDSPTHRWHTEISHERSPFLLQFQGGPDPSILLCADQTRTSCRKR